MKKILISLALILFSIKSFSAVLPADYSVGQTLPASELNQMIGERKGNLLPIDETTREYINNTYSLGSSSYKWLDANITSINCTIITANGGIVSGTGNQTILIKEIDIGTWNMDTTASLTKAHGLTSSKILFIKVQIIRDDGLLLDFQYNNYPEGGTNQNNGSYQIDGTNINFYRLGSGYYDSTDFDGSSNRGKITIFYTP